MIIRYFCQRLFLTFIVVLSVLATLLSIVNVVGKNTLGSADLLIAFFCGSLPFMAVFIFPFVLLFSNLMVFYLMRQRGELTLINFFKRLRQKVFLGVLIHSSVCTFFLIPLIFIVAPQSYDWGKQLLLTMLEQKLILASPGTLHFPLPGIGTYFEESSQQSGALALRNFFLIQQSRRGVRPGLDSVFWGDQVLLVGKKMFINHGCIIYFDQKTKELMIVGEFKQGLLNLERFFSAGMRKNENSPKYQTIFELVQRGDSAAYVELCKRSLQVFWVLLTAIPSYYLGMSQLSGNISWMLAASSIWFFVLYGLLLALPIVVNMLR